MASSYMPWAASGDNSRNGEPGSSSRMTRSRGSNLPRDRWRSRMRWGPPSAASARRFCSSSANARMRAALAENSADAGSMLDVIGNRFPPPQLYALRKPDVNGPSEWNNNESSEMQGTEYGLNRCPFDRQIRPRGDTRGDVGMRKSLLATAAAIALIAGTGMASAEGAKEQPAAKPGQA